MNTFVEQKTTEVKNNGKGLKNMEILTIISGIKLTFECLIICSISLVKLYYTGVTIQL